MGPDGPMPPPSGETTVTGSPTSTRRLEASSRPSRMPGKGGPAGGVLGRLDDVVVLRLGLLVAGAHRDVVRVREPSDVAAGEDVLRQVGHRAGGERVDALDDRPVDVGLAGHHHLAQHERGLADDARHPGDLLHHLGVLGHPGLRVAVLEHHHVGVGPEDLLLQIHLEAAHHAEDDDQRHHPHPHAADAEGGHHLGGRLAPGLRLVDRLRRGQRVSPPEHPDAGPLHRRLRRPEDRRG